MRRQFFIFCIIGMFGFIVDLTMTKMAIYALDLEPWSARIIGFIMAVIFTWYGNRTYTYKVIRHAGSMLLFREFVLYLGSSSIGITINYIVYLLFLNTFTEIEFRLTLAIASGSLAALSYNFVVTRFYIFKH